MAQVQEQPVVWCYDFNTNLKIEMRGARVEALHIALEKENFNISQEEKSAKHFGESTASAVSGFQQKYADEILTPLGLKYGTGFVGKVTRAKLNALYGCGVVAPAPIVCAQVITPAQNPQTGECKNFPTPCDVPRGWTRVNQCPTPTQPSITVLSPNGGEKWEIGGMYKITYQIKNSPTINIENWKVRVSLTTSPTVQGETLISLHPLKENKGYIEWMVPLNFYPSPLYEPTDKYYIMVELIDGTSGGMNEPVIIYRDSSDAPFSIVAAGTNTPPKITTISPIPLVIQPGQVVHFSWSATDADNDNLVWSTSWGDGTGQTMSCPSLNKTWSYSTSHSWAKAGIYTIRTEVSDCRSGSDSHSQNITVATSTTPSITILYPQGGEKFPVASGFDVKWQSINIPSTNIVSIGIRNIGTGVDYSIATSTNDGSEPIALPGIAIAPVGQYKLFVKSLVKNSSIHGWSNVFSIVAVRVGQESTLNQMANVLESARQVLNQMLEVLKR